MRFLTASSPHIAADISVSRIMRRVLYATVPGLAALVWFFGIGVLVNLVLACGVALALEALMLVIRGRPIKLFLTDCSVLVTAVLLALSLPPLSPWWMTVLGVGFAVVVAKHLYGGLGYNPFNPAMVGYVVLLISFPLEMSTWLPVQWPGEWLLTPLETVRAIFTGELPARLSFDAVSGATPLDTFKVQLGLGREAAVILQDPVFGWLGGRGWEWVNLAFLLGGLWLVYTRTADWRIPAGMLGALTLIAGFFYVLDPVSHASPWFHLFSGATMLGAFFIATDPVSASTTPRGRLLFGAGVGVIVYVIRSYGGYPDGVAFAVLLMNITAPALDYYTQPRVFGTRRS